jgi:hypothetical protein
MQTSIQPLADLTCLKLSARTILNIMARISVRVHVHVYLVPVFSLVMISHPGPKHDEKGVERFEEAFQNLGRFVLQIRVIKSALDRVPVSCSRLDASLLPPVSRSVCWTPSRISR